MDDRYVVLLILASLLFSASISQAGPSNVSDPDKVNDIIPEIDTPQIDPGSSEEMKLTFSNPYNRTMEEIRLTIDIYGYEYLDEEKDMSEIEKPPFFEENGEKNVTFSFQTMSSGEERELQYDLAAEEDTEEGVYLVRFELEFVYLEEDVIMRSRGYFTGEEWEDAKEDSEEYPGGFNLTKLDVDGILSDSSFTVKSSIPRWPQYALGATMVGSGTLAVMFYMQEKYGSFPWLEKAFDDWAGKLDKLRSYLKKRSD